MGGGTSGADASTALSTPWGGSSGCFAFTGPCPGRSQKVSENSEMTASGSDAYAVKNFMGSLPCEVARPPCTRDVAKCGSPRPEIDCGDRLSQLSHCSL